VVKITFEIIFVISFVKLFVTMCSTYLCFSGQADEKVEDRIENALFGFSGHASKVLVTFRLLPFQFSADIYRFIALK